MKSLYRIYIDEVGNHDMKESLNDNERFLTLFGVIIKNQDVFDVIQPQMQEIKMRFFQKDPDEPVILHRKEISRYQGIFSSLQRDREKRIEFGNTMLEAYGKWPYVAIAITIDKKEHFSRYETWRHEPYHYCLEVLLERYVLFLHYRKLNGDVMVEARGTKPDGKLAKSFNRIFRNGTSNIPSSRIQSCLTSRELKIKTKGDYPLTVSDE